MERINSTFEVEVELNEMDHVPLLSVEASFKLTEDGPVNLSLDYICEVLNHGEGKPLVLTKHELDQIRFAVADAIERKYWSGEYSTKSA